MNSFFKKRIITLGFNTVVCIAIICGTVLFVKNIFDKQKQVDDIKSRIEMLKNNSEIIKNQTKKLNTLTEQQLALENVILTKENAPKFFSTVESVAKNNNVEVTISSVSDVTKNNKKTLNLEVRLAGGLSDIQSFYRGIQSLPVQILIERVIIAKDPEAAPIPGQKKVVTVPHFTSQASLVVLSY